MPAELTGIRAILPNRSNAFGYASLFLTVLIALLWQGNTPFISDDLFYQRMPLAADGLTMWNYQGEYITSFSQVPAAVVNHYNTVNGRGANLAYLAMQPLPMWVIKYFCGAMLALLGFMLWRLNGVRCLYSNMLAVAVPLLLWTGLQWNDHMQSSDFQFNYTLPSVMLVGCLMVFALSDRKPRWWGWLLLAVFSVWHEAFTVSLGVVLFVFWLFDRRRTTLFAVVVLILGALFTYSPGSQERLAENATELNLEFYAWTRLISTSWVTFVALGLWLWRRRRLEASRKKKIDIFALGLVAAWIPALFFLLYVEAPQRSHWPNDVLAVCLTLLILNTFKPFRIRHWVAAVLLALYAAWGASLVYWQCRVTAFTDYCLAEVRKGKTVVADTYGFTNNDLPFWLMGMLRISYSTFDHWSQWVVGYCGSERQHESYLLNRPELVDRPITEWEKVPGTSDFYYATQMGLVRLHDGTELKDKKYRITFGEPTVSTSPLDRMITALRGLERHPQVSLGVWLTYPTEVNGDSVDVVFFGRVPRSFANRPILAVDEE